MYYLSFPGLGIEPFHIDKVAFSVFGRDIAWYGILITCGMLLAVLCSIYLAKIEKISVDDIVDLAFFVIIFGVIGARAYYVIFSWNEFNYVATGGTFFENLWGTIYNIIAVWEGGLAIYGGVIAGLITAYVFSKVKKIKFLKLFDILAPCVLIGQIIGRWGNFINIEAYGAETSLPWRMGILFSYTGDVMSTGMWTAEKYVHPTFLYESLWNLVALVIILSLYKKKRFDGQMFSSYLIWYGFGRMLIEGLRTDSLMLGVLRVSQLVGLISFFVGVILMICLARFSKKYSVEKNKEYVPIYENAHAEISDTSDENTDSQQNSGDKGEE